MLSLYRYLTLLRLIFCLKTITVPACMLLCTGWFSHSVLAQTRDTLCPTGVLSGGGELCRNGGDTTILIRFTGDGPYQFVYSESGVNQPLTTTLDNPFVLRVRPPRGTVYKLESVANRTCRQGEVSGEVFVGVFAPSTARLAGDYTFCNKADTSLNVDFTGTGPFFLTYAIDGVLQKVVETSEDPLKLPVNTTVNQTVSLISVASPGCTGFATGQSQITVLKSPRYTNLRVNCTGAIYRVSFDVVDAELPLVLVSGTQGRFTGTRFESNPLAINQPYSIVFRDANACQQITVSGASTCNCTAQAGTMGTTPLTVCAGVNAVATHDGQQRLDSDDVLQFALHTNPGNPIGQVLAWNSQPSFALPTGARAGVTYYISAVVGNRAANGQIDLTDACMAVSEGTPVTFIEAPTATMARSATVCSGTVLKWPVALTGLAPFTLRYSVDGTPLSQSNISEANYDLLLTILRNTDVRLLSVSDRRCTTNLTAASAINVFQSPRTDGLALTCDPQLTSYRVSFDVTGRRPFIVDGLNGNFTGSRFVSTPIIAGQQYRVVVSDSSRCAQTTFTGARNCMSTMACTTKSGTMNLTPLQACANAAATAIHNGNQTLDPDDVLRFILHTRADTTLGTILATAATPNFAFQPGRTIPGVTYYISAVAGNQAATGDVSLTDPCLSVSAGTPVVWSTPATAQLSGTFDICPGDTRRLVVRLTGRAPYSLTYSLNGIPITTPVLIDSLVIVATHLEDAVYRLVSISDACGAGTATGSATVRVSKIPQITDSRIQCAPDGLSFVVIFRVTEATPSQVRIDGTVTGVMDTVTGVFTSQSMPLQTNYRFVASDLARCGRDSVSGIGTCPCETKAGQFANTTPIVLCGDGPLAVAATTGRFLQPNDTLIYVLATQATLPAGTIVARGSSPALSFNAATMQRGQTYYLLAVAGNRSATTVVDLTDPCLSVALGPTVRFNAPPAAALSGNVVICPGETRRFRVNLSGGGPYTLTYSLNNVPITVPVLQDSFIIIATHLEAATYRLVSVTSTATCSGTATGSATIQVRAVPRLLNPVVECTQEGLDYRVTFAVDAPSLAGITIAGGRLDTAARRFTSDFLPVSQQNYKFVALTNCGRDSVTGRGSCPCRTEAGRFDQTPLNLCNNQPASLPLPTGRFLQRNDTIIYVLATQPVFTAANVVSRANRPVFNFDPATMTPDRPYYIFAIAGDRSVGPSINLTDTCLSRSNAVEVRWRRPLTASISGNDTICAGDAALLRLRLSGGGPYSIVLSANGTALPAFSSTTDTLSRSVSPQATTTYRIQSVTANGCTAVVSDSAVIRLQARPTAAIVGDTIICPGGNATIRLGFTGQAPFQFQYSLNGVNQPALTANNTTFQVNASNIQQPQQWRLVSVQDAVCSGTVNGTVGVGLRRPPTLGFAEDLSICPGNTARLTLRIAEADSANVTVTGGPSPLTFRGVRDGFQFTVTPTQTTRYTLAVDRTAGNACTAVLDKQTVTVSLIDLTVTTQKSDFKGFNISCPGLTNGFIRLSVVQGTPPYRYRWSDGADTSVISGLQAGVYTFTVTDNNGCSASETVRITEPPVLSVDYDTNNATCRNPLAGGITVNQINGGAGAYQLTVGGQPAVTPTTYPFTAANLTGGTYTVTIRDANGCTLTERIVIQPPPVILVNLGDDKTIALGDSVELRPLIQGDNFAKFTWTPDRYARTPDKISTFVRPLNSIRYKLVVVDTAGCTADDDITVIVEQKNRLYRPNVFRPGSSDGNEWFQLFGGPEVKAIQFIQIFTRWGEKVFEAKDFAAGDLNSAWDGRFRNRDLPPDVYVYKVRVEYINGDIDVIEGDVTLVR
jgi:CHU_C Type IX secretion signal domain